MIVTASELRQNVYKLLDQVLETGLPIEIERKGRRLRVVPADPPSKLDRIVGHDDYVPGDPEGVLHIDWFAEWRP